MLFSMVPFSTPASSLSGTREPWRESNRISPRPVRLERTARGNCRTMSRSSTSLGWWARPTTAPLKASRNVCVNAVELRLLLVHNKPVLGLLVLNHPVYIHHARRGFKFVANLARHLDLLGVVGAVDLGHQCLDDRRSGGNLRHLYSSAEL